MSTRSKITEETKNRTNISCPNTLTKCNYTVHWNCITLTLTVITSTFNFPLHKRFFSWCLKMALNDQNNFLCYINLYCYYNYYKVVMEIGTRIILGIRNTLIIRAVTNFWGSCWNTVGVAREKNVLQCIYLKAVPCLWTK